MVEDAGGGGGGGEQWAGQSHACVGGPSRCRGSQEREEDRLEAGAACITTF